MVENDLIIIIISSRHERVLWVSKKHWLNTNTVKTSNIAPTSVTCSSRGINCLKLIVDRHRLYRWTLLSFHLCVEEQSEQEQKKLNPLPSI